MTAREKKPVEYKDTFTFRAFPEYTYTRAQSRRLLLFQGRADRWKKAVNYAAAFPDPNRISLLFMIGYTPAIKPYVEKLETDVTVLCAKVPRETLEAYDRYWKAVKTLHSSGEADRDGNLLPLYFTEREKRKRYPEHFADWLEDDRAVDRYGEIQKELADCFKTYTLIDKHGPERPFRMEDLDSLILKRFPRGREACGMGERGYIGPKRLYDAIDAGLDGTDPGKILCLPEDSDGEKLRQNVSRLRMNINTALREKGYAVLSDLFDRMSHPPYGWGSDPHAAYCFAAALRDFLDTARIWDGINMFPCREAARPVIRDIVTGIRPRWVKRAVLVTETGARLSKRIAYIFDIQADAMTPADETDRRILELRSAGLTERKIAEKLGTVSGAAVHKRLAKMRELRENIPLPDMTHKAISKITACTRWPVSLLDERLTEAIVGYHDLDGKSCSCVPAFGKERVRELLDYFTEDRCRELRAKFRQINILVPAMLRDRYGQDTDTEAIKAHCTAQASCWLWSRAAFFDCADKYLEKLKNPKGSGKNECLQT